MNGAGALLRTLTACGVDTCFMNPGTSEMHFVAALDEVPEMRGILTLFEGVATGAADGFARMAGRPATALLHLGPGLGNGIANLHNARRARSPVVCVVGDHATYHKRYDAPLESDIDALASNVSGWIDRPGATSGLPGAAVEAYSAAVGPPGQVATLILPADVSWSEGADPASPPAPSRRRPPPDAAVADCAAALRSGRPVAVLVGGDACRAEPLVVAGRIAAATGAKLMSETFPARLERGAGLVAPERLAYLGEMAMAQLDGMAHLVLVGATHPVSFFAYPDKPSDLVPDGCQVHILGRPGEDLLAGLEALAQECGIDPSTKPQVPAASRPDPPMSGPLTAESVGIAIGALLPEAAIVADESNTSGLWIAGATAGAAPHDWLTLTGGSIGIGLPLAVGAAVASPNRRVVALEADGSAMYTGQALWTMAREGLDITTVILSNRSYAILNMELQRVGASSGGARARRMLDLHEPDLDFAALAASMGVPARRAEDAASFSEALSWGLSQAGPTLVDAVVVR